MICPKCGKELNGSYCDSCKLEHNEKGTAKKRGIWLLIYNLACLTLLTALFILGKTDIRCHPWNIGFIVGIMMLGILDVAFTPLPEDKSLLSKLQLIFFWGPASFLISCFLSGVFGADTEDLFWAKAAIILFPIFVTASYLVFPAIKYLLARPKKQPAPYAISALLLCVLLVLFFFGGKAQWEALAP